ncbi:MULTISPECIES: nicotinate phosphoribosyltransferase [Dialister]|jgi:nicotinate phosphoribosyltransferase|uniref:Nicotinate phosphoribosyltransferase n=1 Tax=Dialister hominis TaxID=2582419 RepID=A0A8D4UTA7_9FIRM|nr:MULTISPECIES: nicotinate phosphoribosyltransferase [Dialister]MBP6060027.1 nicotinate phosphoribosyltransferase [Dialister sp.]MCH3913042.1 nicotinate phosphoribosyltransferase [Dialister sp.]MEE1349622.1 nicotinate phosphoribosyltransferase [Dialister hominis]CDD79945.1 nicotinate phosphoribosyltransferase [Dialister sp. CAG:357]BBK24196.1 nicotinate phosphoribosyltransferase [Dialister hominis]
MASNGLITDLYQLTMANALFKKGMHERKVVFDRFYRKNPFDGGYTVVAGIQHLVDFVKNFRYDAEDIEYLRSLGIFYPEFLDYLKDFRFHGDIYAMPEGTVAFPGEILLRFHGTTTEAMLIETGLSMIMNHESLIATKARRVRTVAPKDALMEFGLRRAQGHSAGLWGARAAMIGGFNGTSNVEAGCLFGIPVLGTMAHSWIMSFDTELEAFEEYVRQYHDNLILLADTYNVLEMGVPHAIQVFKELKAKGQLPKKYGIRIDSGDLGYLSREATRMFTEAGFPDAIISGSNDLDEYLIQSLKEQGCTVTSWGVGTKIITADGTSALGGVFKMSAREQGDGFEPVMKISNDVSKMTNPGIKTVRRFYRKDNGKMITDLICLENEAKPDGGDFTLVTESAKWRKKYLKAGKYTCEEMLKPVMRNGEAEPLPTLKETIAYANEQMETLWPEYKRLMNPNIMEVNLSDKLQALKTQIIEDDLKNR